MTTSAEEIQAWIVARVSSLVGVAPDEVDVGAPLTRHGLDSVALITLVAELEKWLGCRFRENPFDAHPTIEELARFLAEQAGGGERHD
jgi:acyl carrier protein